LKLWSAGTGHRFFPSAVKIGDLKAKAHSVAEIIAGGIFIK